MIYLSYDTKEIYLDASGERGAGRIVELLEVQANLYLHQSSRYLALSDQKSALQVTTLSVLQLNFFVFVGPVSVISSCFKVHQYL